MFTEERPRSEIQLASVVDSLSCRPDLGPLAERLPAPAGLRSWLRLLCTDEYDTWLIAWGASSEVGVHDHGDSHGAIRVVEGSLVEAYRDMGAGRPGRWRRRTLRPGRSIEVPPDRVHSVSNPSARARGEPARVLAAVGADEFLSRDGASRSHCVNDESIEHLLALARAQLARVTPSEAAAAAQDGALLVDIRPVGLRDVDGEIPGALVIDRNVLEWRLSPSSDHRIPEADARRTVIIVCDEGYASSLAAATLQGVGLPKATDLIGGFQAWKREGLPVRR